MALDLRASNFDVRRAPRRHAHAPSSSSSRWRTSRHSDGERPLGERRLVLERSQHLLAAAGTRAPLLAGEESRLSSTCSARESAGIR